MSIDRPAVLVTGGAGYIGSHTCKALAASGYLPVTLDNLTLGHRWAVQWGPLEVVDLLDLAGIVDVIRRYRVRAVIHFAGSAYVGDSLRNPAFYYRNNLEGTLSLMNAMRVSGVSTLVFSSSCSVYGNPTRLPVDEDHPTLPLSPYGQTKLDCENAIRWFAHAYGIRWIALRYFNAAGADPDLECGEDHDPETRLVPRAILAALGHGPGLEVFGTDFPTPDGTAIRDYVHVSDLAEAHLRALGVLNGGVANQVINLGTGCGYSVREVMHVISRSVGREVPHSYGPRRTGDPAHVVADGTRAARVLEWIPKNSSLENIVTTACRWHIKHKGSSKT